jgi:RND family efflux transporter MFP subunit
MKTWQKYLSGVATAALAGGVFYLAVYIPKHTFSVIQPVQGELQVSVRGIGNVDALHIYPITAQSGGKILKILADNGSWVKKGDLLVLMDGVDLPQQVEAAKAALIKAEYDIKAFQSELENQKAQKALSQITYDRYKRLWEKGFASAAEYDKATADLHGIDAVMAATSSRIDAAKASATIASKNIDALSAKTDRLRVFAPIDGYVVSRDAEVSQSVSSTTPILTIVDPKTLWIKTKIDERISSHIQPNQKADITLRSQPNKHYVGVVQRVSAASDPVTLEREINVAFESIPKPFYINEQAEVQINAKKYADVLKVPVKVVVQKNGHSGVWTLSDGHAKFLETKIIAQNDKEIALSNIDKNSKIITPDAAKKPLFDGMKIYQ